MFRQQDCTSEDARLAGLAARPEHAALSPAARARWTRTATSSGPGAEFPYAPERKYTPVRRRQRRTCSRCAIACGFSRNVIVQATCHGDDNRAMADACRASGGRARGVATVRRGVSDAALAALHAAGVRGVRFNFLRRLVDFTPRDELTELAHRIQPLGWHVVVYFEARDLPELFDFFTALPTIVVVDHLGRPDVTKPIDGPEFGLFLDSCGATKTSGPR